jgi:hypothetical protein
MPYFGGECGELAAATALEKISLETPSKPVLKAAMYSRMGKTT